MGTQFAGVPDISEAMAADSQAATIPDQVTRPLERPLPPPPPPPPPPLATPSPPQWIGLPPSERARLDCISRALVKMLRYEASSIVVVSAGWLRHSTQQSLWLSNEIPQWQPRPGCTLAQLLRTAAAAGHGRLDRREGGSAAAPRATPTLHQRGRHPEDLRHAGVAWGTTNCRQALALLGSWTEVAPEFAPHKEDISGREWGASHPGWRGRRWRSMFDCGTPKWQNRRTAQVTGQCAIMLLNGQLPTTRTVKLAGVAGVAGCKKLLDKEGHCNTARLCALSLSWQSTVWQAFRCVSIAIRANVSNHPRASCAGAAHTP
jgi:hypothetical protein